MDQLNIIKKNNNKETKKGMKIYRKKNKTKSTNMVANDSIFSRKKAKATEYSKIIIFFVKWSNIFALRDYKKLQIFL